MGAQPAGTGRAEGKAKRETWKDWRPADAPEPPLLTRAALLALAERVGLRVTERDLRYWEAQGVLPGPVRRRHHGATRALYPRWMIDLIYRLRRYQEETDLSLAEIASRLRAAARFVSARPPPESLPPEVSGPLADYIRAEWPDMLPGFFLWAPSAPPLTGANLTPELERDLSLTLGVIASGLRDFYGVPIARAEARLIDEHGRAITIPVQLRDADAILRDLHALDPQPAKPPDNPSAE